MRPRRWIDGLFLNVYLNAETVGVAVSGMRLCMRSLDGGGRGSAEMGYFVLIKVDICVRVQCIRPDEGIQRHSSSCPSELATVRCAFTFRRSNTILFHLVREHFSAPLLQFAKNDSDQTFTLVECPSKCLDNSKLFT